VKKNILITGPPGSGKTTLIEKVVSRTGLPVTGFLTREIRERGVRVGFFIETCDGQQEILAHIALRVHFGWAGTVSEWRHSKPWLFPPSAPKQKISWCHR